MKKFTLCIVLLITTNLFAQFTTGTVNLTATRTIKIDTNTTTVTLTITGPDTRWLGIGFGGNSMSSVVDMFIWNSSTNRDYTPSGSQSSPSVDASQSWTIVSDNVASSTRTVVATRPLVSSGDFTFTNDNTSIDIIYNRGTSTALANHGNSSERGIRTLTRSALGLEEFSLNATQIYPNPSTGKINLKSKSGIEKVNVYSHVGAFIKTILINNSEQTEFSISNLSSGIYLLELINDNEKAWKKVIIN